MERQQRLRIAIQKSGRLTDHSLDLLARCGLKYSRGKDQLMCYGENMPLDVLFVRDDDIPDLVQEDVCDLGIVGLNVIEEKRLAMAARGSQARFELLQRLDFGHCRLSLAVPDGVPVRRTRQPGRPAHRHHVTRHVLARFLRENSITAEIVTLSGAVEIAPRLGRADLICDLVSTGSTLIANHLREVETVLREPGRADPHAGAAAGREGRLDAPPAAAHRRRAAGAREQVHHAARAPLRPRRRSAALLPGSESPTVIPLDGRDDKVAVHAVCRENVFWETLESLKAAGASAVLVLPVEKMLP